MPSKYDGVALRGTGDPVLFVKNPPGVNPGDRRAMLDALGKLNRKTFERFGDPETQTRISQYEMAFRMQSSVPELTDLGSESKATLEMYGPNVRKPGTYAHSAILTRRLIERGVRTVQILHRGWDQHGNLPKLIKGQCMDVDQPTAALVKDLKQRGLLEDTLVVFGGEFGRTVYCQGKLSRENYGRDHHPRNFCMWMAGGGVKAGTTYGETDDFSYNITENPVHLNEINATIMHCLGIDNHRFTFPSKASSNALPGWRTPIRSKAFWLRPKTWEWPFLSLTTVVSAWTCGAICQRLKGNQPNDMNYIYFALLTVVCWGTYGVCMHIGSSNMADKENGRIMAFLWVGLAYFLTAVVAPLIILKLKGGNIAFWSYPTKGWQWSLIAGTLGAIGALGVLLAFGKMPSPAYVPVIMSIIFAGAPMVNAIVSTTKENNWET